ncbi:hypothetical protein F4781DRAFT_441271 [Annulohypoxylon bovei var. microspora]|nr:hypothetical protein F4781DRAFT_441271 [Annulohypoxylon bovei var. microspora]
MSPFFVGETDTQDSRKRFLGVQRRPRAASDSSSTEVVNSSKRSRPPTPPPRRSSWDFSQQRDTSPTRSPKHRLRRKLKWPSLRFQFDSPPKQNPQVLIAKLPKQEIMSSPGAPTGTLGGTSLTGPDRDRDRDRQATTTAKHSLPMPGLSGNANGPIGNLLKGPVDESGRLKDAALLVGIKLDLEAEIHATARVRGDIVVGLY